MNAIEKERLALVILGIVASWQYSYIAAWEIAKQLEALGYQDVSMASQLPETMYDEALQSLLAQKNIEELPDLHYRYRLKRRD